MQVSKRSLQIGPTVAGLVFGVLATLAIGVLGRTGLWIVVVAASVLLAGAFAFLAIGFRRALRQPLVTPASPLQPREPVLEVAGQLQPREPVLEPAAALQRRDPARSRRRVAV